MTYLDTDMLIEDGLLLQNVGVAGLMARCSNLIWKVFGPSRCKSALSFRGGRRLCWPKGVVSGRRVCPKKIRHVTLLLT
jgi:hypothetical protein